MAFLYREKEQRKFLAPPQASIMFPDEFCCLYVGLVVPIVKGKMTNEQDPSKDGTGSSPEKDSSFEIFNEIVTGGKVGDIITIGRPETLNFDSRLIPSHKTRPAAKA